MHDERVGLDVFEAVAVETEHAGVFAGAGEETAALTLVLDPEEIDHVRADEGVLEIVADADAGFLEFARDQRGGSGEGHVRAELEQTPHVAAGHAAVEDVADDGDVESLDPSEFFADGEHVQQRLGRMAVRTVAGVDDAAFDAGGEEVRGSGGGVAHDDQVCLERFDVADRIQQRFALAETAGVGAHVDDVGAEALFRQFEGDAGAGAGFDEDVDHGLAPESGDLLDPPAVDFFEFRGGVEDESDLLRGQVIQTQQIFFCPGTIAHKTASILGVGME